MPYDEGLAARVEDVLRDEPGLESKKMFGGIAFLLDGHMCCGVAGEDLMLRIGPEAYDAALEEQYARPMDFTGRPLRGMIFVSAEGVAEDPELSAWVARGTQFVRSLPPKGDSAGKKR